MTIPALKVIPAGAGSGKTYTLQEQLGQWVVEGLVAPDRIVAVTFTEAAAAELRERIKAKLLALGRIDDALRLDKAYISTIHGFGLRILTEFAFDAGYSPQPRLLGEEEEDTLIRLALAQTDKANVITADLGKYGYRYDYNSGRSREEVFRDTLLRMVALLRSIGPLAEDPGVVHKAVTLIADRYGKVGTGKQVTTRLRKAVKALLAAYPRSLADEFGNTGAADRDLRDNFRTLSRARATNDLEWDWSLWQSLRSLRTSNRSTKLPEDYDALAQAVIEAADVLPAHPGPLAQERVHVEALIGAAQDIVLHYTEAKRKAGLVDYSDMIAMASQLLRNHPAVLKTLVSRIDCLVVDEFQDTNPLQFDLLWQLKSAGVPAIVVGDMKQAIMGFQGADPRLFEQIITQNSDCSEPLTRNWRSEKRLMGIINQIGKGLFGSDYVALKPTQAEGTMDPLELLVFPENPGAGAHDFRAGALGRQLVSLLSEPSTTVLDKRTKQQRALRGSDIAVLCPTHGMLAQYADRLRSMGLKVRLQEAGWFESPLVQILYHALAYVANPNDRHAALYLAVTEFGNKTLQAALQDLRHEGRVEDPVLASLDAVVDEIQSLTIYAVVERVLGALDVYGVIKNWPDAQQQRANCLRLQAEAGEFMDANREALASGGYYGSGIQSFLGWLTAKVEHHNNQPDPTVVDEDAIELATWHSAKGKEWPIVAVCGLERTVSASLPDLALGYASFKDLTNLLSEAVIDYWPKFAAPETNDTFLADLQEARIVEAKRLLYVALTRPREKLLLEWPSYKATSKATSLWSTLVDTADMHFKEGKLFVGKKAITCSATVVTDPVGESEGEAESTLPAYGRRALVQAAVQDNLTPDSLTPSAYDPTGAQALKITKTVNYRDGLSLGVELTGSAYGNLLHRTFEILSQCPERKTDIPAITEIELNEADLDAISQAVKDFEELVDREFSPQQVDYEVPVVATLASGSLVSGTIDILVTTDEGVWVIDHKSDRPDSREERLQTYRGQLACYAQALSAMGEPVLGVGIHWVSEGSLTLAQVP